jgi:hypothetical protein
MFAGEARNSLKLGSPSPSIIELPAKREKKTL